MKLILFLIFSISVMGQKNQLEIKIDTILTQDLKNERVFTINYHIQNLTNQNLSFFLDTKNVIPNAAASMRYVPYYRFFQNKNNIDMLSLFNRKRKTFTTESDYKKFAERHNIKMDSVFLNYKKSGGISDDKYWVANKTELLNNIMTLGAKETKTFSFTFYWDKTKYYREGDMEYIIDEKDIFEMDLTINLMKKDFKNWLSTEEYSKIALDKNFVEGVFTSNKMILNLN